MAAMGALVKQAALDLPNTLVVFGRNAFGLLFLAPVLVRGGFASLRTDVLPLHLIRTLAGLAAMYCFFWTMPRLHLAEAVLLNYTAPLFIPLVALLWLREPVPRLLLLGIGVGFAGVLFILRPTPALFQPAALVGLFSGMLAATAMVGIRRMSGIEPARRVVFYFTGLSTAIAAIPAWLTWQPLAPRHWALLAGAGALATVGQLAMTRAYQAAPAAQVGPFTYAAVPFAGLYGFLLWGERPGWLSLVGMVLVISGGVLALRVGRRQRAAAMAAR